MARNSLEAGAKVKWPRIFAQQERKGEKASVSERRIAELQAKARTKLQKDGLTEGFALFFSARQNNSALQW